MAPIVGSKQAEQLKQDGNNYFQKNRFGAAIDAYTEAITLCPNVPIYWTNRALCHRRRNDWRRVEEDCRRAIQLDHNSVKAHYYLGLALLQKEAFGEGVRELEKALDLGRGVNPGRYIVGEIWEELAKAKYMEWEHESTRRSWELQNLKSPPHDFSCVCGSENHVSQLSRRDICLTVLRQKGSKMKNQRRFLSN